MSTVLSNLSAALVLGIPFLLLVCRFCWPKRFPWWVVVVGTACASWVLYDAQVHLGDGVLLDEQRECLAAAASEPPPGRDCPLPLVDYWELPDHLKWVPGIIWL